MCLSVIFLNFLTSTPGHPVPPTKERIEWIVNASRFPAFTSNSNNEPLIRSFHPFLSKYEAVAVWEHPEIRSFWLVPEPPELLGLKMPVKIGDRELLYWPGSQELKPHRKALDDPLPQFRISTKFPLPEFVEIRLKEMFPSSVKAYLLTSACGIIAISFLNAADCNAALEGQRPRTIGGLPFHFYVQPSSGPVLPWPWDQTPPVV